MVFPNSVLLGQNLAEILFLLWLAFWTKKLQKHNWKRIPYGIAEKNSKKSQRLTHLWAKARSSFFSEWKEVQELKREIKELRQQPIAHTSVPQPNMGRKLRSTVTSGTVPGSHNHNTCTVCKFRSEYRSSTYCINAEKSNVHKPIRTSRERGYRRGI